MLLIKPKHGSSSWQHVSLDSLPPLEVTPYNGSPSSSPPPGRQRLPSKRPRSDGSPELNDKTSRSKTDLPTPPRPTSEQSCELPDQPADQTCDVNQKA